MTRPISEVLRAVYARLELVSSIYGALDACVQYDEITQVERNYANKVITKWLNEHKEGVLMNVTKKRIAFKKLIQRSVENERLSIR